MKKAWICLRKPLAYSVIATFLLSVFMLSANPIAQASPENASRDHQVGPKQHYLALGDSLAFGYQEDADFIHGYADLFAQSLSTKGMTDYANMGCPGETSLTMINGQCPYPTLRKYPYTGSQLQAAIDYIKQYAGQVSPVTLSIGANDVLGLINTSTCQVDDSQFQTALAALDANLTQTILPGLKDALTIDGEMTGDILVTNLYDPFQNNCPNTVPYVKILNAHLAQDVAGTGTVANVFKAFGGAQVPNAQICSYTWICSQKPDIHPTDEGYAVIEAALSRGKYCSK